MKIYINGVIKGTSYKPLINTTLTSFRINAFAGAIDDLKIYDRALNSTQVLSLYQNNTLSTSDNNNIVKNNISIYPNPSKDVVFVKSETAITKIELYDFSGKKIKESASKEMNISSLKRGNYLIKITDKEGNTQTKNLIKE